MSGQKAVQCFHCGAKLTFPDRVGIRAECEKCGEDVHVCKNCVFYDPKAYNECREPQADVVREKDRANMCDFFEPRSDQAASGSSKEDLMRAAEALFRKK